MKLYLLIHEQDTDFAWGADVTPYTNRLVAQEAMYQAYKASIKAWTFDASVQTEEHECCFVDEKAVIRDGTEMESWRIEEQELCVRVAIEVEGGLVQAVYSDASVSVEVYDLDVPEFPTEEEQKEIDSKAAALEHLKNSASWEAVW